MKKRIVVFIALFVSSMSIIYAQTIGTKKNVILKITGYECNDFCYLGLKDIATGLEYSLENTDVLTKDNGILQSIQDNYYKNGESDKQLIGKTFKAIIEYRKTDIFEYPDGDGPPRKTGKKKTMWMINSLSR